MQKLVALVAALLVGISTAAGQAPTLVYTSTDLGSSIGFDVSIAWNDAATALALFELEVSAQTGAIVQNRAFAVLDINTKNDADTFTLVPGSGYDKNLDSWCYAGFGQPFSAAMPPYNGVDPVSGQPGQSTYRASFITDPLSPVGATNTPILHLVMDKLGASASAEINGIITRLDTEYGYKLEEFRAPHVELDQVGTWTVSFDMKRPLPGGAFSRLGG